MIENADAVSIPNRSKPFDWTGAAIVLLAALFRLVLLGLKPAHFDEGVNGWFVDQMTRTGLFRYDPENYHGPLHFYVLFLFQTLFGRNLWALRVPVALVSTLTVWLVLRFDRFIGQTAARLAALALAVSPGAVFYGRYSIHESWQVFFLILLFWGIASLWDTGSPRALRAVGLAAVGMVLTKETYVIHWACLILAVLCLWGMERLSPSQCSPLAPRRWAGPDLAKTAVLGAGLIVFFYSGNLLDFSALSGLYETFRYWIATGTAGHGHEKTAYDLPLFRAGGEGAAVGITFNWYYLALLFRYEWMMLAGLAASVCTMLPNTNRLVRLLAVYGIGTLVAYSLVNYKTPWCVLSLFWPFAFVAGDTVQRLLPCRGCDRPATVPARLAVWWRAGLCGLVAGLLLASSARAVWLNFYHYTDEEEPYVYVQTFEDVNKLTEPLFALVRDDPANYHLRGRLVLSSFYPLPWVLGDFTQIGYHNSTDTVGDWDADFLLVEKRFVEEADRALRGIYFTDTLRLRAAQDPVKLYLRWGVFHELFPLRQPEFVGGE